MKEIFIGNKMQPITLNGPPARGTPGEWLQSARMNRSDGVTVCPDETVGRGYRLKVEKHFRKRRKKHPAPGKQQLAEYTVPLARDRPVRIWLPFAGNYLHVPETGMYCRQKTDSSNAESVPDMRYPAEETKVRCREPAGENEVACRKTVSAEKKEIGAAVQHFRYLEKRMSEI